MTLTELLRSWRESRAHAYASENADLYRGFDNGQRRAAEALQPIADALGKLDFEAMAHQFLDQHKPEPGGCTCGFCNWSVEHVLIMFAQECAKRTGRILGK